MAFCQLGPLKLQAFRQFRYSGQSVVLQLKEGTVGQAEKLPLPSVTLQDSFYFLQGHLLRLDIHLQKSCSHGDPYPDAGSLKDPQTF